MSDEEVKLVRRTPGETEAYHQGYRLGVELAAARRKAEFDIGSGYHRRWMEADARAEVAEAEVARQTGVIARYSQELEDAYQEQDTERARADRLAALLRRARNILAVHHEAGYKLEWGQRCTVCAPYGGEPDIFTAINAALSVTDAPAAGGR